VTQQTRFRGQILNACIGALVFTLLGSAWAVFGLWSLGSQAEPLIAIILALFVLVLLIVGISVLRKVLRLPQAALSSEMRERIARVKRGFGIVNLAQGIAIGVTFMLGFRLRHAEYIPPVVALIVGLHFLALAPILRTHFDYIIGLLLCSLALVTVFTLPVYADTGDAVRKPIFLWGVVIGTGTAVVLWLGAISRLRGVREALRI
jgi:MFS family permease